MHDSFLCPLQIEKHYSILIFFPFSCSRNLQAAICSYFDFESTYKLPCMTLLCDSTIGEGESVPPNTKFRKSWRVQNSGTEPWPENVCLSYTGGAQMGECTRVPVPCLPPKETVELSVDLTSPSEIGTFQSKWRMMTQNGSYFGGNASNLFYCYDSSLCFVLCCNITE